jgi:hypothetical protein
MPPSEIEHAIFRFLMQYVTCTLHTLFFYSSNVILTTNNVHKKQQNLGNERNVCLTFLYQNTAPCLSCNWSLDTTRITILQLDISGELRRTVNKSLPLFPRGRNFYSIQLEMMTKSLIYEMSNRIAADIGTHVSLIGKRFSRLGNLRNEGV